MATFTTGRNARKLKEPKELLMFFPEDYSAVKVPRKKILGTFQQLSGLKENTWVDVDIGEEKPWRGLVIKTGQSLNELGRCELAFLAFLSEHADDKENIPLNDFFAQMRDTDSDEEESVYELKTKAKKVEQKTKKKTTAKRLRDSDDPTNIENKKEKKLKREQARAQALASKKQSDEIFKMLENMSQDTPSSDDENIDQGCSSEVVVIDNVKGPADKQATPDSGNLLNKLKEMFAESMKGIHERFDSVDRSISALVERQVATENKLEEVLAAKASVKSKVSRPLNLVVSHSPMNGLPMSALQETPERQPARASQESPQSQGTQDMAEKETTGYIGHKKYDVTASPAIIKRAEEQARGVPKTLAFNLLNILVDIKTQAESNISGQNGKKALDKNIIGAIQSHLANFFEWTEDELEANWKRDPMNIQQRIADKCRNLNKKKN